MADESGGLTAEEAADYLGVTRATLYAYVSRGLVASEPAHGARRKERRYPRQSLDRLRERRTAGALRGSGSPVLESSLTLIEGGRLWYRGRDACELSRTATFEEVACLLWTGSTENAAALFPSPPSRVAADSRRSLGDRLVARLVEERVRHPFTLDEANEATLRGAAATIVGLFEAAGARGSGTLAERLARGWRAGGADDLQAALILCADHELNTSAFTARCVASVDAPIANVLLAALCALEGRRHGGVSRELEDLLDEVERLGAERACRRALERRGWLPGFSAGTPIYPQGDPRAAELLRRLALPPTDAASRAIDFARSLGGTPSLELALAAFARIAGLPTDAAFAIFALGRSAGWVAHALEEAARGTAIRPRARYTGPSPPTS
jgi:citrate synthase